MSTVKNVRVVKRAHVTSNRNHEFTVSDNGNVSYFDENVEWYGSGDIMLFLDYTEEQVEEIRQAGLSAIKDNQRS